jgi:hypothetical protein
MHRRRDGVRGVCRIAGHTDRSATAGAPTGLSGADRSWDTRRATGRPGFGPRELRRQNGRSGRLLRRVAPPGLRPRWGHRLRPVRVGQRRDHLHRGDHLLARPVRLWRTGRSRERRRSRLHPDLLAGIRLPGRSLHSTLQPGLRSVGDLQPAPDVRARTGRRVHGRCRPGGPRFRRRPLSIAPIASCKIHPPWI